MPLPPRVGTFVGVSSRYEPSRVSSSTPGGARARARRIRALLAVRLPRTAVPVPAVIAA